MGGMHTSGHSSSSSTTTTTGGSRGGIVVVVVVDGMEVPALPSLSTT